MIKNLLMSWSVLGIFGVVLFIFIPHGQALFIYSLKLFPLFLIQIIVSIFFVLFFGAKKGLLVCFLLNTLIIIIFSNSSIDFVNYYYSSNLFWHPLYSISNQLIYSDSLLSFITCLIVGLNYWLLNFINLIFEKKTTEL